MIFKKIGGFRISIFILPFCYFLLFPNYSSASENEYPVWKVKLAYTLIARGKSVEQTDPGLAKQYYIKADKIYPLNPDLKKPISAKMNKGNPLIAEKEKVYLAQQVKAPEIKTPHQDIPQSIKPIKVALKKNQPSHPVVVRVKKFPEYAKAVKGNNLLMQPTIKKDKGTIIAEFQGINEKDMYAAEEKGPTVNTILDPYHPNHKGFTIPYFKDREGLKIAPWIGVRGEYMYDEERVGIETLMLEAQEFNQRRNDEVRDYISVNKKQYYREEVILHIRENLPQFTFINHEETVKRRYEAKKIWNTNDTYYDNYDRRHYQLDYTIPRIKKIGFLKLTLRYIDNLSYRTNDPAAYMPFNSYLVGFYTAPYSVLYNGTFGIKFDYQYSDGEYKRAEEQGWSERKYKENQYWLELNFYNQRKYLSIKPHFYWEKEQHSPSHDTWWTKKTGLRIEKGINGKLKYTTDWTYVDYTRIKSPSTSSAQTISASSWTWENEMEYEIIRDLKFTFGLDYGKGLGFDAFDNVTARGELMLRKPGLIDLRVGYRYTDYINVNDGVDTVYFKFGWFI